MVFFFSKMSWEKILWTGTLSAQVIYISSFVFWICSNYKRSVDSELTLCHLLSNVRLTKMCRSAFWLPFRSVGFFFTRPNCFNAVRLLIHKMRFGAILSISFTLKPLRIFPGPRINKLKPLVAQVSCTFTRIHISTACGET